MLCLMTIAKFGLNFFFKCVLHYWSTDNVIKTMKMIMMTIMMKIINGNDDDEYEKKDEDN